MPPCAWNCQEGTQLPSKWHGFPFLLCVDFSEKGNRIISSLLYESLRYRSVLWREVGHLGSPAVWRRETGFLCHHPGQEGRHPGALAFPGPVHLPSSGTESKERMLWANLKHFCMKSATAGLSCEDETASAVDLICCRGGSHLAFLSWWHCCLLAISVAEHALVLFDHLFDPG